MRPFTSRYQRFIFWLFLLCLPPATYSKEKPTFSTDALKAALVKYVAAHPLVFEGYTAHLNLVDAKIIASPDRATVNIGPIKIDLLAQTYIFERWLDRTEAQTGTRVLRILTWTGRYAVDRSGKVTIEAPNLMREYGQIQ